MSTESPLVGRCANVLLLRALHDGAREVTINAGGIRIDTTRIPLLDLVRIVRGAASGADAALLAAPVRDLPAAMVARVERLTEWVTDNEGIFHVGAGLAGSLPQFSVVVERGAGTLTLRLLTD